MSSLVLNNLYNYISKSMNDELITLQSSFYSFVGKTTEPTIDESIVKDNLTYDTFIRDNLVFAKKIPISDIAYLIPRYNWASGIVYDMYDDNLYGSYVATAQIINGGSGYVDGTTYAYVVGGGGTGATLALAITSGVIVGISVTDAGDNYISTPTVSIIGAGVNANIEVTISSNNLTYSGKSNLKDSMFYVVTSGYNVYKCLYNKLNAISTIMPTHTTVDPYTTADGYVWKFMYNLQLGTRKKFLTTSFMPVYNVLTSSYYSDGGIDYVEITNPGINYTTSTPLELYVSGNGVSGNFLGKINLITKEISAVSVLDSGVDYYPTTTKLLYSVVCAAGVATLTTDTAHNLVVGKSFTISGTGGVIDGTFVVASSTSSNVITFDASPAVTIAPTTFSNITVASSHTLEIVSVTRLDNVVTVITTIANKLNKGNIIKLTGITEGVSVFNGTYIVDKYINSTTFAFNQFGINEVVAATVGIVNLPPIGILDAARDGSGIVTITTSAVHNFKAPYTIDTISRVSGTVTVTTDNNNYYFVGDTIVITGATGFNGRFIITNVTSSKIFKYSDATADASGTVGYVKGWVVVTGAGGFNSAGVTVDSVPDSKSFTYSQAGALVASTAPQKMLYDTTIVTDINLVVSGKYGTNTTAILSPNLLIKNGIGYTGIPLVYIYDATGIGTGATAIAVVPGTKVTQINMTNIGSGYITQPEIYFNGGSTEQATATAVLNAGVIASFTVTHGGGYYSVPKVLVVDPTGTGAIATAVIYNGELTGISVVDGGHNYTAPVVYFTGTSDYCCSATAILYDGTVNNIEIDSIIDSISIDDPGIGYDESLATIISIDGDGIGAELTPVIVDGSIKSVVVSNAGEGYSYADLTVVGDGSGAILRASLNTTNILGQRDTVQYNAEVLAVAGAIDAIVVTNGGTVPTTATVTITGDGSDATATAIVVANIITEIIINNRGSGYTHATVTITGAGASASARAILPPHGGHGYNAITELCGNDMLVYTKVSNEDIYNTFNLTNVFYQYGVICNPKQYDSTKRCSANIISPCVSVAGTFSLSDFALNDVVIIVVNSINKSFRIVDITASSILLQTIDVYLPIVGEVVNNVAFTKSFTITAVIEPSMSLNSGSIIDINNTSSSFYKTASQIISLRTLFNL